MTEERKTGPADAAAGAAGPTTEQGSSANGAGRFRYAREGTGGLPGLPPDDAAERAVREHYERWGDQAASKLLTISSGSLTDLAPLARLTEQVGLELTSERLTDIGPLAPMVGLRELTITAPVLDLAPLTALSRLEHLVLRGVRATDLAPLSSLTALTELTLERTRVRDLRPLTGLPALRHLTIADGLVADATPLAGMGLETVTISRTWVEAAPEPAGPAKWTIEPYPPNRGPLVAQPPKTAGLPVEKLVARYVEAAKYEDGYKGFGRWLDAGRELIATKDATAIAEVLCSDRRLWSWISTPGTGKPSTLTLRGLVLRGGQGSTGFPADNAWGIPPDAGLAGAIRHVWAPLAECVPAFVDRLVERAFGVALVSQASGYSLAYLYGSTMSSRSVDWEAPIEQLMSIDDINAEVCWGAEPRLVSDRAVVDLLGGPLPAPLRQLAAVHGSLYFSYVDGAIDCDSLAPYTWGQWDGEDEEGDGDEGRAEDEGSQVDRLGLPRGRYVIFAGYQDGAAVFDLDRLDALGNPTVAGHDCNDGLNTASTAEFWDWLDRECEFYLAIE